MNQTSLPATPRNLYATALRLALSLAFLLILLASSTSAQTYTSPTDGSTPLALSPGAPAGSYPLSDFDNINLYNGNLNFALPMLHIGGRGAAQMTMTLSIEQHWQVKQQKPIPHCELSGNCDTIYSPWASWWGSRRPGYGPGVLQGRQPGVACGDKALTRLTFTAGDGTEYELRDRDHSGEPLGFPCGGQGTLRGTVFITADGSAATFISDAAIYDWTGGASTVIYPSGYLLLKDGTRYRIDSGLVTWMRDRNGNKLSFAYTNNRVTSITDSLNRQVTITYGVNEAPYGLHDQISFTGFGGMPRMIRVSRDTLDHVLRTTRSGDSATIKTVAQLFPEFNGSTSIAYNPTVVSSMWLPDGRRYKFSYNVYGELARVELPTGGATEYDFNNFPGMDNNIYRRVFERRVYADGVNLESKTTYSDVGPVTVDSMDANGVLLSRSKHYFNGTPAASLAIFPTDYAGWKEGREIQTEVYAADGTTLLRRVVNTWEQRAAVSWWTGNPDNAPANDPRLTQTKTTLWDTNQATQQTFSYDQYNNQTDALEYDYGQNGVVGLLVRHTHTDYANATNLINGVDYTTTDIHLRSLPLVRQVYDAGGTERARTIYEYDNYTTDTLHAGLRPCDNITGLDATFTNVNYSKRGNVTSVTSYANAAALTGGITSAMQYDVAGNAVKALDGRGNATTLDFADHFGAPDGEARGNNTAQLSELNGQTTYAFPTKITNALGFESYTQFDYYLGAAVNSEDINGVVISAAYGANDADKLDRPSQLVKAINTPAQSQTSFSYDDTNHVITTLSDLNSNGDKLKSETLYDGLGRTTESRTYEGATFITSRQVYDALGRVKLSYNPYRSTTDETYGWAETTYDALSRMTRVETFNASSVSTGAVITAYSGTQVLVTDQAGKKRISQTNALGQLTDVWEITPQDNATVTVTFPGLPAGTAGYLTHYDYDTLDNLKQVTQGGQQPRTFNYDSLKRLTSAFNPESGTVSYEYDNNGNLKKKTDARGIVTDYVYDALNRSTSRSYSNEPAQTKTPTVTYCYDTPGILYAKGRLTSVTATSTSDGLVSKTNYASFDALGRVTASSQQTNNQTYSMSYEYDLAGNLKSEMYPSGRVIEHSFDAAGRISSVTGHKANVADTRYASQINYTPHGALASVKLGNSTTGNERWEHTTFNSRLQPVEIGLGNSSSSSELLKLEYTYGVLVSGTLDPAQNNGNVQNQSISIQGALSLTQTYEYDALNRLTSAREVNNTVACQGAGGSTDCWKQVYSYDRYGNRSFVGGASGTTLPSVLDTQTNPAVNPATNRYSDTTHYGYDAAGNLTASGGDLYDFDGENQIVIVHDGNVNPVRYVYDGDGRRVKKVTGNGQETSVFVYNALGQMVAEYNNLTPAPTDETSYLTTDTLGTPRVITKADGSVKSRHDYLPFGEEVGAGVGGRTQSQGYGNFDGTRQRYTSKERDDETGLDYFINRYYSSTQGRFTGVDPVKLTPARMIDPQQLNLYAYVRNNPLKFIDPDGKDINFDNDTKNGRRKALLSITANMTAKEARNVGVRWNKDTGKYEGYIKDPSKIDLSKASQGYNDFADRVGNHDLKLNYTFLEKGKSTTVEMNGVPTKVTNSALSGARGADAGGFVAPQSDGSFAVVVAEGGYTPGVAGLTQSGKETAIAFPDYLVTAHELFGETYKYTPAGIKEGLQNNVIDDSNKVIEIENKYRDFHGLPHRSGTDHGYVHGPTIEVR